MARGSADGNWQPIKLPSDVDSAVKENSKPISVLNPKAMPTAEKLDYTGRRLGNRSAALSQAQVATSKWRRAIRARDLKQRGEPCPPKSASSQAAEIALA
jgi:hypothetical protein